LDVWLEGKDEGMKSTYVADLHTIIGAMHQKCGFDLHWSVHCTVHFTVLATHGWFPNQRSPVCRYPY